MSIFNEYGNCINLRDPLERMPYVMNEINMICNNYDYITEGININDIKNAIKKAWLKFKTFITDALRSIKIKINDNTNKLLRYIEKNKTKVDEILKDKHINNYRIAVLNKILNTFNKHNIHNIITENIQKNNTELLAIIRGELSDKGEPVSADDFENALMHIDKYDGIISNSTVLIKNLKEYQAMIKSIDSTIRKTEQTEILKAINKDPNLDFTNGLISIYNTLLSYVIKTANTGIKDIMNAFNGEDKYSITMKYKNISIVDKYNYIDNNGVVKRDKIVMDIKYRKISRSTIETLCDDKRIQSAFIGSSYSDKRPKQEWTKDYLNRLSYAVVAESFNRDYLLYLDDVADYVSKNK